MAAISVNDSSTGGPLAPSSPPPVDDLALAVVLQVAVAGVTGIPRDLVLPRWQPTQPRIPDVGETWCALDVTTTTLMGTPAQIHNPEGDGSTTVRAFYQLDVLASFYGPNSDAYARLFCDGLYISQNRDFLRSSGLNLIGFDPIRRVPDISGTQARRKSDLPFRLTQVIERQYSILNVRQASGTIQATGGNPQGSTQIDTPFASPLPPA